MILLPHGLLEADGLEPTPRRQPIGNEHTERFPLRVLLLNLMPEKQVTERDIIRMLEGCPETIELIPLKIAGQTYKTTPMSHMDAFYVDFDCIEDEQFDALIVTGAPVEHLPYEDVRYWPQLCHIFDWTETHVRRSLYICWAAQAALYHFYGIRKHSLPTKSFGVFNYQFQELGKGKETSASLVLGTRQGSQKQIAMPTSRHTSISTTDVAKAGNLHIVAHNIEQGVGIVSNSDGSALFVTGHLEYAEGRLGDEYRRDLKKGLPIAIPQNYFVDESKQTDIAYSWKADGLHFYHTWIEKIKEYDYK